MFESSRRGFLRALGIGAAVATPVAVAAAQAPEPIKLPKNFKDPFHIPPELIPPGVKYNWKRVFVTRDHHDFENLMAMRKLGWAPVPMTRHADYFRPGTGDSNVNVFAYWIEVGGLLLMEKPI